MGSTGPGDGVSTTAPFYVVRPLHANEWWPERMSVNYEAVRRVRAENIFFFLRTTVIDPNYFQI